MTRHRVTRPHHRQRSHHLDARHHDGHRPSINAAKCPRVVNGSLTGSEHHRSRSEGTLRRHRSQPRRIVTTTRPCASIKRTTLTNLSPGEGPHHNAIVTTTAGANPQSLGIWKLATTGGAPASGQRRHHRQPSRASTRRGTGASHQSPVFRLFPE
jgi:hypothetical protein